MGHSVIKCDDCQSLVMEAQNYWKCSCGWVFNPNKIKQTAPNDLWCIGCNPDNCTGGCGIAEDKQIEIKVDIKPRYSSSHYDTGWKQHLKVISGKLCYLNEQRDQWLPSRHRLGLKALTEDKHIIKIVPLAYMGIEKAARDLEPGDVITLSGYSDDIAAVEFVIQGYESDKSVTVGLVSGVSELVPPDTMMELYT